MPLLNQKYDFAGMFLLYIRYAKGVYIKCMVTGRRGSDLLS